MATTSILKKLLVAGTDGTPQELDGIAGSLVRSAAGETFEAHTAAGQKHVPAGTADGSILSSKNGASPEWVTKETVFTDAALSGTPTAPTAAAGTKTTQIATTEFVDDLVAAAEQRLGQQMTGGVRLLGNLGDAEGDLAALPTSGVKLGDAYFVAKAGTYGGFDCEVGDTVICNKVTSGTPSWFVVEKNLINAVVAPKSVVADNLLSFADANGSSAADSGIAKTDVSDAVTKKHEHSNSADLAKVGSDANGNLTFDGKAITGSRSVASVEEAAAANAPAGTLFFVVETTPEA